MADDRINGPRLLIAGDEALPEMVAAIDAATRSIRLETFIFRDDVVGRQFRDSLVSAQRRGVHVRVLIDAVGSWPLPNGFWEPLTLIGGESRSFNPIQLGRFGFRNHRKLLVCDEASAFVGGFNIGDEYYGDGVNSGWRDLGLWLGNSLAGELAASFDEMFARADFQHHRFARLRKSREKRTVLAREGELLLSGPGRGRNPFKRSLRADLARARDVRIVMAYFLPPRPIRRDLMHVARRGGRVQLILPGKTDVPVSQFAARSLYRRLLKAGVEIYEYEPCVLHAKLIVIGGAVYAGSANLDPRSLNINYELMLRFQNRELTAEALAVWDKLITTSRKIELEAWQKSRSWWRRLRNRWSYFFLARVDPFIARWQYKRMIEKSAAAAQRASAIK